MKRKAIPKWSLASGLDYGVLSRVCHPELPPLSELEEMLISENRLYHMVVKVCSI